MPKSLSSNSAQALIEYIFIFAFVAFLSVQVIRTFGRSISSSVGSLSFHLTQELTTGVCPQFCFNWTYENRLRPEGP